MKQALKYIELKSGFGDNGPAWIGLVDFSKSGQTIYFNNMALKKLKTPGISGNHYNIETGDEYWVSGVKKNGHDRHQFGDGPVQIDRKVIDDYLKIVEFTILDKKYFELIDILPTNKQNFVAFENEKDEKEEFSPELSFKKPNELTDYELEYVIESLIEDEENSRFNKGRRSFKRSRLEFEEELENRKKN